MSDVIANIPTTPSTIWSAAAIMISSAPVARVRRQPASAMPSITADVTIHGTICTISIDSMQDDTRGGRVLGY